MLWMKLEELRVRGTRKIATFTSNYRDFFWYRFLINLLLLLAIWMIRFPHVFKKLYAEDGVTLLQGTYENDHLQEFVSPVGGFSQLVARIGARFMRLFPIEYAPASAATFTALCMAFLSSLIYQYSKSILKNSKYQCALSIFFLFIPIANFNSVGTICNLYFYFMTAAGVLLFSNDASEQRRFSKKNAVIFFATLTNPLCLFLAPLILGRMLLERTPTIKVQLKFSDLVWAIGMLLQFCFIIAFSLGKRTPHPPSSILSTFYLFLDRGIGSALIPNWGFVSGDRNNAEFENTLFTQSLLMRALLSFVILVVSASLMFLKIRTSGIQTSLPAIVLFTTSLMFSLLIGLTFSVEPRYMIFSSFFIFYAVVSLISTLKSSFVNKVFLVWFVVLISMSLTPSNYISKGPDWQIKFNSEKEACNSDKEKRYTQIRIMPLNGEWIVKIPCTELAP